MARMSTFIFSSPGHIVDQLVARFRARRLAKNWSRKTLAERSGVSESTIKRFETTGSIKLDDLVQMAVVLHASAEFGSLFPEQPVVSLDQLSNSNRRRGRQ